MNRYLPFLLCSALAGFAGMAALATIIPSLDLPALCDHADLVVVGRAVDVRQAGPTTIVSQGESSPGRLMVVQMDVEKVLKGPVNSRALAFTFSLPAIPVVSSGYRVIASAEFGVFFLRKAEGGYEVLDPYHPYVVATPGAPGTSGTCSDQITAELAHVTASAGASARTRMDAVEALRTLDTPAATAALETTARDRDLDARTLAIAALLERGEMAWLDQAARILLFPEQGVGDYPLGWLAFAIGGGVKDPRAVPTLARLLRASDPVVRRAAASALRNTRAQAAVGPLTEALRDTDREVQYQAVIGLAEITGVTGEWAPASGTFLQDPQRYLDHWREWAESRK